MTAVVKEQPDFKQVIASWKPNAELFSVGALTPDASFRRYFRLALSGRPASVLAMVFDSTRCPEVAGGVSIPSNRSYVELTHFFKGQGIAVPDLYFDAGLVLLIEDLGDELLANRLLAGDSALEELYQQAVGELLLFGALKEDRSFFPFQRRFSPELFVQEMDETKDYLLRPLGLDPDRESVIAGAFGFIAEALSRQRTALSHRDFHSWNLMLDPAGKVRVIDFQDALMAPRAYDLVALLNDRDTDAALGEHVYRSLLHYYFEKSGREARFWPDYDLVLLQRDLKVAGRFRKLSVERGLPQYEKWIPGTLQRVGATLRRATRRSRELDRLFTILLAALPEVEEGRDRKLELE
jgi:N-acetylmuramate 1-kinase